jgi:hypothetical protein
VWELRCSPTGWSAAGEALFPRRYEATLWNSWTDWFGREGRDAAVAALEEHFRGLTGKLKVETAELAPAGRLAVVAQALADEGYMAESPRAATALGH